MNFTVRTVYKHNCPEMFRTKKVENVLKERGRAVIYLCKITGAYYLNGHRIYEMEACQNNYDSYISR